MKRIASIILGLAVLALLAPPIVWALSAGTNISLQNGQVAIVGPPSATTLTSHGIVYGNGTSAVGATAECSSSEVVLGNTGAVPTCGGITNARVDAAAAIARSKIANGTADHVVINGGGGALSSEATLAGSRGGLGGAQPTCTATQRLTCNGTTCTCSALPVALIGFGSGMDLTTSQTVYAWPGLTDATEARVAAPVGAATFANLRCRQSAAAGGSNNVVITIRTGTCGSESDSSLVCTITGGASAATCSDTSNTATTTAGQCAAAKITTPAALTNNQVVSCTMERTA